jgi:hypothetical protein
MATYTATGAGDLQTAFNNASSSGDEVFMDFAAATLTTQYSWNAPPNSVLRGRGIVTSGYGDDNLTVLTDSYDSTNQTIIINTSATGTCRIRGFTFKGGVSSHDKSQGLIGLTGSCQKLRIDHCFFDTTTYSGGTANNAIISVRGNQIGVVDHCTGLNPGGSVGGSIRADNFEFFNSDALGYGDQSWAAPTNYGSGAFLFIEDCVFTNGYPVDSSRGGRYVFRFNVFNTNGGALENHPTGGGGRVRGSRACEIYCNTINVLPFGTQPDAGIYFQSGTMLCWGNSCTSTDLDTGVVHFIQLHSPRYDQLTYGQTPTPDGWGSQGTHHDGTGSGWDGNINASSGYPGLDAVGRGQGDLLVNDFPSTVNNTTGTIAWPNQALEPVRQWVNVWTPPRFTSNAIVQDIDGILTYGTDYWSGTGSTSVTGGIGNGTLASRPGSASTAESYWANDVGSWNAGTNSFYVSQGTLYVWNGSWTTYYTPYIYPHPLVTPAISTAPYPQSAPPPSHGRHHGRVVMY